jgi:hypothetical protein
VVRVCVHVCVEDVECTHVWGGLTQKHWCMWLKMPSALQHLVKSRDYGILGLVPCSMVERDLEYCNPSADHRDMLKSE